MGWFTKSGKNDNKGSGGASAPTRPPAPAHTSADIRAQALANARIAREAIGEETLQKLADALRRKQQNPVERAKARIAEEDAAMVAERIIEMLDE